MNIVISLFVKIFMLFIYTAFHVILTIIYWGRRKEIAPIKNPLILQSATSLAREIHEGKIKSEDVIQAYIERIQDVEPYINATVDRCFQRALEEAREVDNLVESKEFTKEQLAEEKPLLGIPFSVKLLLTVKGLRCTAGSKFYAMERASEDSPAVALMRKAGAIVIATTNTPELGLHIETDNFLHGKTCNPYDNRRTPGGSSGGEGALIGAAGSLIGIANDFSGSIRLPSHFNGIFGHKPSHDIVPNGGCFPHLDVVNNNLCTGPICRYAEDLVTTMKVLAAGSKVPMQLTHPVNFGKLKILYLTEVVHPLIFSVDKEIIGGLEKAVSHFRNNYGADAKKINLPLYHVAISGTMDNMEKLKKEQGLMNILTNGKGTTVNENIDSIKFIFGKSDFSFGPLFIQQLKKIPFINNPDYAQFYKSFLDRTVMRMEQLLDEDTVLLLPTFNTTAPYHFETLPLLGGVIFMFIFNILGYPSTQCHIGISKDGMPYGIQIAGKRNNDALTMALAIELERAFGGWVPPGSV